LAKRKYKRKTTWRKAPRSAFKPGDPRINRKGREKGSQNRITVDLKQAIINALDRVGGEAWFVSLARKDRRSFSSLIGKLLPTRLTGGEGGPLEVELVNKAQAGLANLTDKELNQLQAILSKVGISGVIPQ
jgi:hypothetical protein